MNKQLNAVIQLPDHLSWLCPVDVDLIRLGDKTDGGYLIPKIAFDTADSLLSLGLGENWSFDEEWHSLKPNDPVHLYDGTKTKLSFPPPNGVWNRFQPLDLVAMYENFFQGNRRHWTENIGNNRGETSLRLCLDRLGGKNVFLKTDIEGGEYTMLQDLLDNSNRIIAIAAEFHGVNSNRPQFQAAIMKLKEKYDIIHVHANITQPLGPDGLTEAIEITLLRKDLCPNAPKIYDFYRDQDYSNLIGFFDMEYWFEEPKDTKTKKIKTK